jgi:hypothetical protein
MGVYNPDGSWEPLAPEEKFIFRPLSPEEVLEFRKYALENDPPADTPVSILHPVCVDIWRMRGVLK